MNILNGLFDWEKENVKEIKNTAKKEISEVTGSTSPEVNSLIKDWEYFE